MFGKGAQGAASSMRVVVFGRSEAVIDKEQHSIGYTVRNLIEKRRVVGADFGLIIIGKSIAEYGGFFSDSGCGIDVLGDEFPILRDKQLSPFVLGAADEVERKGIEDFVAESDAGEGIFRKGLVIGREIKFSREGRESLLLGFSE